MRIQEMINEKLKVVSTDKNLRLCVIENSIFIEEMISDIIGRILNINWKNSKSFGFNSTALSFNQKVQIILDIKGIDKQDLKKLISLMNIRNKFAHVSHIKTFEDLFTKSKVGKELRSNFNKWYFDENGLEDIPKINHEKVYRLCFYLLINNIAEILLKIYGDHMFMLGKADGEKEFKEKYIKYLTEEVKEIKNGKDILNRVFSKIEK